MMPISIALLLFSACISCLVAFNLHSLTKFIPLYRSIRFSHSRLKVSRAYEYSAQRILVNQSASVVENKSPHKARIDDEKHRSSSFDFILATCRKTLNYSDLVSYVESLESVPGPLSPRFMTSVIKALDEAGQFGKALGILKFMQRRDIQISSYHFGALINAARNAGQWEMAIYLFDSMTSSGAEKNTIVYNILISTLGEHNQGDKIMELFKEMKSTGIALDVITYSAAITALERCGDWRGSVAVFDDMMHSTTVTANVITLNAVLQSCAKGRELVLAMQLLIDAADRGLTPDAISYSVLIGICGEIQRLDLAIDIFKALWKETPSQAIRDILAEYLQDDQGGSHLQIVSVSEDLHETIFAFVKGISRDMVMTLGDTGTYNAIISACEKCNQPRLALAFLEVLTERRSLSTECGKVVEIIPDSRSFGTIITALGNAGLVDEVIRLFQLMDTLGVVKDRVIYHRMINTLTRILQINEARDALFAEGSGSNVLTPGLSLSTSMTSTIVEGSAIAIQDLILKVYKEAHKAGRINHWAPPAAPSNRITVTQYSSSGSGRDRCSDVKPWIRQKLLGTVSNATRVEANVIELHGFPCPVAIAAVEYVFHEIIEGARSSQAAGDLPSNAVHQYYRRDLKIITGRGNHINNSGERGTLKFAIESHILHRLEPVGFLQVDRFLENDGCILISKDSINRWIAAHNFK